MAGEYIRYLTKDIEPDAPPPPRDRKSRLRNWFYYHRLHLIIAAVLLSIAGDLIANALHIGETLPDVEVAYVGSYVLPGDIFEELSAALASCAEDGSRHGKTVCRVNSYVFPNEGERDESLAALRSASQVRLMADLENCTSFLFLTDDPEGFQEAYQILADRGGQLSPEDAAAEAYTLSFYDCPVTGPLIREGGAIAELESCTPEVLAYLARLRIGRRTLDGDRIPAHPGACAALWKALTGE